MSHSLGATGRVVQSAVEYGRDLAAAFVLASQGVDRADRQQMAGIVMREIAAAVENLRNRGVPPRSVEAYERACREACRDGLLAVVASQQQEEARSQAA